MEKFSYFYFERFINCYFDSQVSGTLCGRIFPADHALILDYLVLSFVVDLVR